MIEPALFLPLGAAAAAACVATAAHRHLRPHVAARLVLAATVLVALGAVPTVLVVAASFLAHAPLIGTGIAWCTEALGFHADVPAWLGALAVGTLAVGTWRAGRLVKSHRRLRPDADAPALSVVDDPAPIACTLPGPEGTIVVSTGLLDLLDERQLEVVMAHERAHAELRHDRYLLVSELAAAVIPPLRWLSARLRFSVERWADEAAVRACGDRRVVAQTLAHVALHTNATSHTRFAALAGLATPSRSGLGVAARVEMLVRPRWALADRRAIATMWSAVGGIAVLSAVQIHHLAGLAGALCPH